MADDTDTPGRGRPKQVVTFTEANRKARRTSFVLYPADDDIIVYIQEYLGCSRSEAVRSAIRAFATNLAAIKGR